jgi:hypothetical protein
MTNNKRIDAELLKRIMIEVENRASSNQPGSHVMTNDDSSSDQDCLNESTYAVSGMGRSHETEYFVEFLGKVLQRVCKSFMIIVLLLTCNSLSLSFIYVSTVLNYRFFILFYFIYIYPPSFSFCICGHMMHI